MRSPRRTVLRLFAGVFGVLLGLAGLGLLVDRPGLKAEYFANSRAWGREGSEPQKPVFTASGFPVVPSRDSLDLAFISSEHVSVRWSGWVDVPEPGPRAFTLSADEGAYLRVDEEAAVDTSHSRRPTTATGTLVLEKGVHRLETGFFQTGQGSRFALNLGPDPGVDRDHYFAERPVHGYRILRRLTSSWSLLGRRLMGALLLLSSVLILLPRVRTFRRKSVPEDAAGRLAATRNRRILHAALLVLLFAATFVFIRPYTTSTAGGDDIRYLHAAMFDETPQGYGRHVHTYLLKVSIWLHGGDAFQASRSFWAFMFAATMTSLAVAAFALGPGLQLGTFLVAVVLLVGHTNYMSRVGATFPDFTVAMFVTIAVAIYLRMSARAERSGRREWGAFVIGALTVLAVHSKETGIVLLLLPLLFLWTNGRADLGCFARRLAFWFAGAVCLVLTVGALDAWFLGDFWSSVRADQLRAVQEVNFMEQVPPSRRSAFGWLNVVFQTGRSEQANPDGGFRDLSQRHLWALALLSAVVAAVRRKTIEFRLLHLLPAVYLLMLMTLHVRAAYPLLSRYLLPVVPICCLLVALMFRDLGLVLSWEKVRQPRVYVPCFAVLVLFVSVLIPYRVGSLEASEFLPGSLLASLGWAPEDFAAAVVLPVLLLVAVVAVTLRSARGPTRSAALLTGLLFLFGPGFEINRQALDKHISAQRGDLILYPWKAFRESVDGAAKPLKVMVSPELFRKRRMVGQLAIRERTAQIFFGTRDLTMWQSRSLHAEADFAIAGEYDFTAWKRQLPGLEATVRREPSGQLILSRPKWAAEASVSATP